MSRLKAATIHLSISVILATIMGSVLYFLWFPPPYFIAAGASKLILVLMGVDVGIGPLLTLIVVSPSKSKKLLKLDLSIIVMLQVLAFGYGIHAIASARPIFVVAEDDRFVLVASDEISDADLAQGSSSAFRKRSWTGPVLVGALPPTSRENGGTFALHVMATGKDVDRLPQFYVTYDRIVSIFMKKTKSISQLDKATTEQQRQLQELQAKVGEGALLTLPLQRGNRDFTIILSPRTKRPLRVLPINSW